eukprot:jgi/Tetstr1/422981/TSEL_013758.t1
MLLSDILKTQVDPDAPHTMHLVIKPQPVASGTPPAPTPPQPAQETLPPLPDNGISPASQAPTSAPVVPAPGATSASRPAQALAAESAGQTSASTAQYYMMNPVMAAAYQAALAAITGGQAAADAGVMPMPFVLPPNLAAFGVSGPPPGHASFPYPFPYPPPPGADGSAPPPPHGPPAPGWAYPPTAPRRSPLPPPAAQQPEAPPGRGADAGDAAAVAAAVGVFALILYQHCSASRFFMLVIGGLLLYLTALVPMRRMVQAMVGGNNPAPRTGLLRELQMLVLGFLASLLPGWNFNPEDAAAFAAAQEMVAAEGQQQQNAAPPAAADPREHQD